jgi:hypothetical protein
MNGSETIHTYIHTSLMRDATRVHDVMSARSRVDEGRGLGCDAMYCT